jgi:integrase
MAAINAMVDVRVKRRALESEEFSRLVETAEHSRRTFRRPNGSDRATLYTPAAMTGLRVNELSSLTESSFDFGSLLKNTWSTISSCSTPEENGHV